MYGCPGVDITCPNGGDCNLYFKDGGFEYADIRGGIEGTLNLEFNNDGGYHSTIDASNSKALSIVGVGSIKPLQEAVVLCPPKNEQNQARCLVQLSGGADSFGAGQFYKAHFYLYEGLDDLTLDCTPNDANDELVECGAPTISCYTALDFRAQDECQAQVADGVWSCDDNRCEEPLPEGRTTIITCDADSPCGDPTIGMGVIECPDTGGACEVHCELGGQCSLKWGLGVKAYLATNFSLFCNDYVDGCENMNVYCPTAVKGAECNVFIDHHGSGRANMMRYLTLSGQEHNAVHIEVNGAAYALQRSAIWCPESGSCSISLGADTSFALYHTYVYAEDSTSLTIVGDGAASPFAGGGWARCPESSDSGEPMCRISLTGAVSADGHTLFESFMVSTYAGIDDVQLECDYTTSAERDCGEPTLECYYYAKNTRKSDKCDMYVLSGTDEWGCGNGQCGASMSTDTERVLALAEVEGTTGTSVSLVGAVMLVATASLVAVCAVCGNRGEYKTLE